MFLPTLVLSVMASAIPPRLPMPESVRARGLLEAAFVARSSILTGDLLVRRRSILSDGQDESLCRAVFDQDSYRVDVMDNTFYRLLAERSPATASVLASNQPLEMLAYGGDHVLCRRLNGSVFEASYRDLDRISELKFFNARLLGLPLVGVSQEVSKPFYREGKVTGIVDNENGTVTITILHRFDDAPHYPFTVQLTISPQQDYAIIGFRVEGEEHPGERFKLIGSSQLAQFNGVWFPKRFRYEQWMNGTPSWGFEDEVLSASFNKTTSPDTFTWGGLGITEGETIFSQAKDVMPKRWVCGEAVGWKATK